MDVAGRSVQVIVFSMTVVFVFGVRWLVAVRAQESFDDIEPDYSHRYPPSEGSSGQSRSLGKHVKERGAKHRSSR